jgi:alginate O-acetyltransferase complex protein AlgI
MAVRFGGAAGVLIVFFVSGLIHDFVITVPAGGGYGLPTAYFLLQALALLLERSEFGKRLKLGQGIRGRLFALLVVAGPAFWLFPPAFVRHVILPMLHAIGAT